MTNWKIISIPGFTAIALAIPLMAQVVPAKLPCTKPASPPLGYTLTKSPTPEQVQSSLNASLSSATTSPVVDDPCAGFPVPTQSNSDTNLIKDETKALANDSGEAAFSLAAGVSAGTPQDSTEGFISTAAEVANQFVPSEFLERTLPAAMSSIWLNAATGVLLNASDTQTPSADATGQWNLIYQTFIDANSQMATLGSGSSFQSLQVLSNTCQRLAATLSAGARTLSTGQFAEAQQAVATCEQVISVASQNAPLPTIAPRTLVQVSKPLAAPKTKASNNCPSSGTICR